jgi:Fe-S cluster biosynthesis and repair protein YggX
MSCCGGGGHGHGHGHEQAQPRQAGEAAGAASGAGGRTVRCVKLGKDLPGLTFKPYKNALGERIYENVSAQAWKLWTDHAKILLNEYRLNLAMPEATKFLMEQCENFFFGPGAQVPKEWAPMQPGQAPQPRA